MSDEVLTPAQILQIVDNHFEGVPIDLERWLLAVAELRAALQGPFARDRIKDIHGQYGVAGIVMCYMTEAQRQIAEPVLAGVAKELQRFSH